MNEDRLKTKNWRSWGPYVSERSWGTVREDYSSNGDAWNFLTHDQARSKAYRWGEDGLAGICDRYQLLVFALALWNGQDEILKERLFGVVPQQNNHGEDVREYYYYLDASPTHSYLKYLYKYPQAKFPYQRLVEESRRRSIDQPEFELLDTGVFDKDRYFDVFVEYAKADPEDICIRVEVFNRGSQPATLHVLPQLWFRNTWSWTDIQGPTPIIQNAKDPSGQPCFIADDSAAKPLANLLSDYALGRRYLYAESGGKPLFTNNETHRARLYGCPDWAPFVKDAFHRYVVEGEYCVNPDEFGTKACLHYENATVLAGESVVIRLRLTDRPTPDAIQGVDAVVQQRKSETDTFYDELHPPGASQDERLVQRQALAGMIWSKQFYYFDVNRWLAGDDTRAPPPASRYHIRNKHWKHLNSMRILSMPDKWEYPWFAAWDLAFHSIPLTLVDPEFAKEQLWLLLFEQFQHPNGQIPAYEWEFSDLNPPVHAWAIWRVYNMDRIHSGRADREFLEKCFHKLLLNFNWWVNKVDADGHNVFEGGFLGLDNITTFDRSSPPSDGSSLKQADATGWMGMYCLNLMRIALELAKENKTYVGLATKFFEHYVYIGSAMKNMGGRNYELWSEEDGLFFDALCYPDGSFHRFRLRSLVSLIPLYAVERLEEAWVSEFPEFKANLEWFIRNRSHLTETCLTTCENEFGKVHLLSLLDAEQLRRIVSVLWDPAEFLSPYGLRSLSKYHHQQPFSFGDQTVRYDPAESTTWLKGGNSNWRGPIWFPTSFLMIEALRKHVKVYGDSIVVPAEPSPAEPSPAHPNPDQINPDQINPDQINPDQINPDQINPVQPSEGAACVTLSEVAQGHANRLISLFTRDAQGRRAIFGQRDKLQHDPHWRDCLLFHEYFNAETGEGLGANHQTGWTGLVASLIDEWRR